MKNNLIFYFLFISTLCFAQEVEVEIKPSRLYHPDTLAMDLDTLYKVLQATHPDLDAYFPMEEMEEGYLDIKAQLDRPMTQRDFFALLNPWYASFGDAHMNLKIPEKRFEYLLNGGYFADIKIKIINNKIYLKEDAKKGINRGSQLASINGVPASKIYQTLIKQMNHDGFIETTRKRILEGKFYTLFPLFFEVKETNELEFVTPGSIEKKKIILEGKQVKPTKKTKNKKEPEKLPFTLEIDKITNTATINIKSFSRGKYKDYRKFLKESFKTLEEKNVENLILDLRNNGGGSADRGSELMAYLAKIHYSLFPQNIVRSSQMIKQYFSGFGNKLFFALTPKQEHSGMRFAYEAEYGAQDTIQFELSEPIKKSYRFEGNTYLLVNGGSASTTALFTNTFKQHNLGTIIGEMPGGTANGTFGQARFFNLPYTKIQARVACIRFISSNDLKFEKMGIIPDHEVSTTLKQWLMDYDAPLEKAKELISQKPEN